MKRLILRFLLLVLLGSLLGSPAFADGITLDGNWSDYFAYTFVGTDNVSHVEIVAPYPATISIGLYKYSDYIACLDINNTDYIGVTYPGTFGPALTYADGEVSWLLDQLVGTDPKARDSHTVNTLFGPIAMAIWQVEFPSSNYAGTGVMPTDPAAQAWIMQAQNAVNGGYSADHLFFTPTDSSSQRFGVLSQTPEPATLLTMGGGILMLGGMLRRRFLA
jgi:hypothetical protein